MSKWWSSISGQMRSAYACSSSASARSPGSEIAAVSVSSRSIIESLSMLSIPTVSPAATAAVRTQANVHPMALEGENNSNRQPAYFI